MTSTKGIGTVLRTSEEAASYATVATRLTRFLGAARHADSFAAVSQLGEKEAILVLAFNNAYDDYILGMRSKEALRLYEVFRDELYDLIVKKVAQNEYKQCARELYKRELAVQFSLTESADMIADAMRSSVRQAIRDGMKLLNDAERIQCLASGTIAHLGRSKQFKEAFRTFSQVLKTDDEALLDAFAYLVNNAEGIRAARQILKTDKRSYLGYLCKVQGSLFEVFASRSRAWIREASQKMREARALAVELGPGWKVMRVTGGMRMYSKEVWDEAILIVRQSPDMATGEAILYMAAQFKAEQKLSALTQTLKDAVREADALTPYASTFSGTPNILTVVRGQRTSAFTLVPSPGGVPTYRYIVNTAGAQIDAGHVAALEGAGTVVEHLELGITAPGMTAIADAFARAVLKVVP